MTRSATANKRKKHNMKFKWNLWFRAAKWIGIGVSATALAWIACAQSIGTTSVHGTVYLANGTPGSGSLQLSWPAFTTADNKAVAAGRTSVAIGQDGSLSVNLAPNLGSSPAGLYYTAVFHMSNGTTSTEYWMVPPGDPVSMAQVRAQVMPAAQAVQAVSRAYVDQAIQSISQGSLTSTGGALTGPLYLNGDPTQPLQAADKRYVDAAFAQAVPASGATMTGPLNAPSITASVNTVINVTAPPYSAKCDGATDDHAAIQSAFNDALAQGKVVEFPSGTCVTSTIVWKGQSFYGKGKTQTVIKGKPGQDVFQGPDSSLNYQNPLSIHDLTIVVDDSVDAIASFPNRVSGTAGGLTPLTNPPAPGPVIFGNGAPGVPYGSVTAGSNALSISNGGFGSWATGMPITVNGAGPSGATLSTTIASVIDWNNVQLAVNASTTVTQASGQWGDPAFIRPPWHVGNCGIAIPQSDGNPSAESIGGVNAFMFRDVWFKSLSGFPQNHVCGYFQQAPSNDMHWERVDFDHLFYGYVEALPYNNANMLFAWTPDTSSYKDMNFKFNRIQAVMYSGAHRSIDGWNVYGGANATMIEGFYWLQNPYYGFTSGTITHYYDECSTFNSGEHSRITGIVNILGGSLDQCGAASTGPYVRFDTSQSTIDAQINGLTVTGNGNTFRNTNPMYFVDQGQGNSIEGLNITPFNVNRPHERLNKLDAGFLLSGNSAAPFTSGNDLLVTCDQFNFAFNNSGNVNNCVNDPTGTEITQSYAHLLAANYPWFVLGQDGGPQGSGPYGKYLTIGDRLPQSRMTLLVIARCSASCIQDWTVNDYNPTTGASSGLIWNSLTFGTDWTLRQIQVDASAVSLGHSLSLHVGGASGATWQDIALIAFQPVNTDALAAAPALISTVMQGTLLKHDQALYPCSGGMVYGGGSGVASSCGKDNTSFTQEAATIPTASNWVRVAGYAGARWSIGSNFTAAPYLVSATVRQASGSSNVPFLLLCGGSVIGSTTLQVGTTYKTFDLSADWGSCPNGSGVGIQFSNGGGSDIILGSLVLHSSTRLSGITGSIGGSSLAAGQCAGGTANVAGAATSMAVIATPVTDPGDAFTWKAYVSAADTVTVKVCTSLAPGGTPAASKYNVRVIQ
jgi:hypothetical protein